MRAKTIAPDFRYPHVDGRLSLARLCTLQGRHDEAAEWFAKARAVLDEPRRGAAGDRERVLHWLDLAVPQFESIGMPGWIRRAEELRREERA